MKRHRDYGLRLSLEAVKDGVWIDTGSWIADDKGRLYQRSVSPPVIMRRTEPYTEAEARERGWLL